MGSGGVQPVIDYENDDNLSDDELLNIPAESLPALSRVWAVRSGLLYYKQMIELAAERSGNAPDFILFHDRDPRMKHRDEEERRRVRLAYEALLQEVRDHADRLLLRIDEQQHQLEKRRDELESRALHLHDGRRIWLDGDDFRDDAGRVLRGADDNEAQILAREHPDAARWTEHENIRASLEETQRIKEKVLAERDRQGDPTEAEKHISQYEKELRDNVEKRGAELTATPAAYGASDYADLLTTQPAFNAAASAERTPVAETDRKETETASAAYKRSFRPQGQGGPKVS
jgi:hypothetical protein